MISRVKSKNQPLPQFDVGALHAALDAERTARGLTWKDVASQSGVSASTLTRLSQGRRPDVDSLAALTHWLDLSADAFMPPRTRRFGAASPLTRISTILREDPNLDSNSASALEEIIRASYGRFKKQSRP
jgi:transcriptional regulator with XRE-family HTH domain